MKIMCKEECNIHGPSVKGKGWGLFTSILVLFMPKCAFCWAAYMSLLSSWGIVIGYQPWFLPVSLALFLLTLGKLLTLAIKRKNFVSFGLALLAGLLVLSQRSVPGVDAMKILAISLMATAILMDNFRIMYKQLFTHTSKQNIPV